MEDIDKKNDLFIAAHAKSDLKSYYSKNVSQWHPLRLLGQSVIACILVDGYSLLLVMLITFFNLLTTPSPPSLPLLVVIGRGHQPLKVAPCPLPDKSDKALFLHHHHHLIIIIIINILAKKTKDKHLSMLINFFF